MHAKIAYISRIIYPSPMAHAQQTMLMAAALAQKTTDTHLFALGVQGSKLNILKQYSVLGTSLKIHSLYGDRLPPKIRSRYGVPRIYNSAVLARLLSSPTWWSSNNQKVLFIRNLDYCYWGLIKERTRRLQDWIFVYEAHDAAGFDLAVVQGQNPFDFHAMGVGTKYKQQFNALRNFDVILTVTQSLADDLKHWSEGVLQPSLIRHASSLPRLQKPPQLSPSGEQIQLGYVGTIDLERGVDSLVAAMRHLPDRFRLRLVGRFREVHQNQQKPEWLTSLLADPHIGPKVEIAPQVSTSQVLQEIDRCDILLQPASENHISLRYRAPLKLFDYMVRGKPIVAADVPCHKELLRDGVSACLYKYDSTEELAACVKSLVENPQHAEAIANAAWKQSVGYTYDERATRILDLIGSCSRERRQSVV